MILENSYYFQFFLKIFLFPCQNLVKFSFFVIRNKNNLLEIETKLSAISD